MVPLLYSITDNTAHSRGTAATLEAVLRAAGEGVDLIQIREKALLPSLLYQLCREAVRRLEGMHSRCRVLVNDRLDVALASGAAGVHLPASGLPAAAVRRVAPPGFLVGQSCHSIAEVQQAAGAGADFCVLGPIFPTPGKLEASPLGAAVLAQAADAGIPVLALGGVDEENAAACLREGAAGVAGIRLFQSACPGVGKRLRQLGAAIPQHRQ